LLVVKDVVSDCLVGLFAAIRPDLPQSGVDKAGLELFCEFIFDKGLVVCEIIVAADVANARVDWECLHVV
jgi:hypothetical protein